jgi:hypothetical protein
MLAQQVVLLPVMTQFKQEPRNVTMEIQMLVTGVQLIVYLLKQDMFVHLQLILVSMCAFNEQLDTFKIAQLIRLNESLIVVMV